MAKARSKASRKKTSKRAPGKKTPTRKGATKKTATKSRPVATKKTAKKNIVTKKKAAKKKTTAKKTAVKKNIVAEKKVARKKTAAKKTPVKKNIVAEKKVARKKTATKKTPVKKSIVAEKKVAKGKATAKRQSAQKITASARPAVSKPAALQPRVIRKITNLDEIVLPEGYEPQPDEEYMGPKHLAFFRMKLENWKRELIEESQETLEHLRTETREVGDEAERASRESDNILELRTRDRYRKLLRKIDEAIKRIEDGTYGYCEETGEEIGLGRLSARPIATLTVDAQERRELFQKQFRDDR